MRIRRKLLSATMLVLVFTLLLGGQSEASPPKLLVLDSVDGGSQLGHLSGAFRFGMTPLVGDMGIRISEALPIYVPVATIQLTLTPVVGGFGSNSLQPSFFDRWNDIWSAEGLSLGGENAILGSLVVITGNVSDADPLLGTGLATIYFYRLDSMTNHHISAESIDVATGFLLNGFTGLVDSHLGIQFISAIGSVRTEQIG